MDLEEKLQKRITQVRSGCKTITLIPGRLEQVIGRLSLRRLTMDLVRDLLYEPQELPRDVYNFFKFAYQTAKRGFAEDQVWNLTDTFREFIAPRLRAFKEMPRHGLPSAFVPCDGEPDYVEAEKRWEEILDKMLYSFEHGSDDEESPDYDKLQEGFELFGKWFQALWS